MDAHEHPMNKPIPETQAVVQMLPEPSTAQAQGEAQREAQTPPESPSDVGATPPPNPLPLYEATSPFWQNPLPQRNYMTAPFYPNSRAPTTEELMRQYQHYLRQAGYEFEAHELELKFLSLIQAPGEEFERLRHELEPQRLHMQEALAECERELEQKKNEFIQQMARARLPIPTPKRRSRNGTPESLMITPRLVEESLTHDFATADEICGQHGVTPTSEKEGGWEAFNRVGQWLMELFAPLFAGLILGVNIAVITGLLRLEDFRKGEQMWLVALAAFIGFFTEKLVGVVYYHLTSSIAQAREQPLNDSEARPFPRLRAGWLLGMIGLLAILLGASVVTVDALGLRMLHEEKLEEKVKDRLQGGSAQANPNRSGAEELLPLWVYVIAGCVISLPYLTYKATMGWRQGELRLREARIAYLRWKHIEQRRGEPEVQAAFGLAQEVVSLQERYQYLQDQLNQIKERLDSARTQSIGCAREFEQYWESLRDQVLSQRHGRQHIGHNGRPILFNRRASNEAPDTLLRRLMRSFRRD
jgi:hypothetical protein